MWLPVVVGVVLATGLVAVIALAIQQDRRKKRRRAARRRCANCQQPLAPGADRCWTCGWMVPLPTGVLEFVYGPLEGQSFRMEQEITTVGSIEGNSIVLPDPGVSRKHLGIRKIASGYELADLGSTNGVYINGQRMAKRLLANGDIIRIGSSEMVFQLEKVG